MVQVVGMDYMRLEGPHCVPDTEHWTQKFSWLSVNDVCSHIIRIENFSEMSIIFQ
ncbi:hypothetical protein JCM31598_27960 [Desulfonatronum parangueonense]